jgi:ArsR family transcriptional regulator
MDPKNQARYQARARVVKALAHPTRLYIIDRLAGGERCVCELQAEIGADMSTVSKHLAVLRDSGLIRDERRGTQVFYTLQATCVPRLLQCVESVVKDNAQRQLEIAE